MDTSLLLNGDASAVARYLRANAAQRGVDEITKDLLASISAESLPPRVFSLWLAAGGDCEAIRLGLHFQDSQAVRRAAINRFGRFFRSKRLPDVWNAIGGTTGVIEYLSAASVRDVKHFSNEIRRSATAKTSAAARAALVDELYQALHHIDTSETAPRTTDQRPLSSIYQAVFPGCSQNLILSVVEGRSGEKNAVDVQPAFSAHTALFRSRCISELRDPSSDVDMKQVSALLNIDSNDSTFHRDAYLSANTQFALEVLEALSTRKVLKGDASAILSEVATPLFRRLARRKCLPETISRATLAYVFFFQRHISNRMPFKDLCSGPGSFLVRDWGRRPKRLESSLIIYLRLSVNASLPAPSDWLELVEMVSGPQRLRLLGLVAHCDLKTEHGLKQSKLQWDSKLLLALPRIEARQVFERLVKSGSNTLNENHPADRRKGELDLLMIKLSPNEPGSLDKATTVVEERKAEASRAREQADRAVCISLTLQSAAASRSLELYRQTLLWTRKYVKDPLTAMEIFRGFTFRSSDESLSLLCGFPGTHLDYGSLTRDQVASNVQSANVIITECLRMACQAQREPGFNSRYWRTVLDLMSDVMCERYKSINTLQDSLKLTDDDVFEVVWRDTLEVCKALEVLGLDDENASLDFDHLGGPLIRTGPGDLPRLVDPRPATLRFLDMYAQVRNELWKNLRQRDVPATLTLVEPYPRGLPLDCLLPVNLKTYEAETELPYLLSRAEQVVFIPANMALSTLPASDDDFDAIGSFVENWPNGLTKYVQLSRNCQEAALSAWEHAIGPLSTSRMSAQEAHLFWSPIFVDSLEGLELDGPWKEKLAEPPAPLIPTVEDVEQRTEWSPEISAKSFEVRSRGLEATVLDAMLEYGWSPSAPRRSRRRSGLITPEIPSREIGPFWSRWRLPRAASFSTREALVCAAMLHVSEANSLTPGIFHKPFPSVNARFPALYLDGDWLERVLEEPKQFHSWIWGPMTVWGPLMQLSDDVPATLLVRLVRALIEAPNSSIDRVPTDALKLLRVLIKGDRPQVALGLIQDIILNRPDDSSWQRIILTGGLLDSLPKQVVEQFLRKLSAAIEKRLSEHTSRKNDTATSQAPRIKVTTVKMLSQLLSGAMYVDAAFASSVLTSLLSSTSHIDVRVSVVESLIDILTTSQDTSLCDGILTAFETHCVPVMSSMNERERMSRDEWMSYDSTNLPELHRQSWGDLPPLLSSMLHSVGKLRESVRQQFFDRILLPTLWRNSETNQRWMQLFLQHHEIPLPTEALPRAPTQLQFLVEMLKWPANIPASVIELWLRVLTAVLEPPQCIQTLNDRISGDTNMLNSTNGQHWLALWGQSARTILLRRTKPATMLTQEWQPVRHDGPSFGYIQSVVLQQAGLMLPLWNQTTENGLWMAFIDDMKPPPWSSDNLVLWHQNVKPVLQQIVDKVEALRTVDWQRNVDRFPAALPDTFPLRVWLLTPVFETDEFHIDDIKLFAASISDILAELGHSHRAYTKRYELLTEFVLANGSPSDKANIALLLGDLGGVDLKHLDTAHDLRVDLTRQLLKSTNHSSPKRELQRQIRTMVRNLASCFDESIRGVAFNLLLDRDAQNVEKAWYAQDEGDSDD